MSAALSGGALEEGGLCAADSRLPGAYCNNEGLRHLDQSSGILTQPNLWSQRKEFHAYSGDHLLVAGVGYQCGIKVLSSETQPQGILSAAKSP